MIFVSVMMGVGMEIVKTYKKDICYHYRSWVVGNVVL